MISLRSNLGRSRRYMGGLQNGLRSIPLVVTFAVVGYFALSSSSAATYTTASEAEAGALSGSYIAGSAEGASGNASVKFGGSSNVSQYLPFTLPSNATLKASPKKVFAHYFPLFPISIDNELPASDYYTTQFLNPNGENGKHQAYGGFIRERPLPRTPLSGTDWELQDMKTEVKRASEAGLDGFTYDLLTLDGDYWDRLQLLLQAASQVDPSFKIIPMPDATTLGNDPATLASKMASIANNPAVYKLSDGRMVISPFYAEGQSPSWWQTWINTMSSQYGVTVALVPCFLDASNATAFNSFSYGFGDWGSRSPAANANLANGTGTIAHDLGKIWMQPVSIQDERPNSGVYDEANNSENLRVTWAGAINGSDWVQIPTWNDYSESAEISPSTHIGYGPLDINSYYLTRFKTGEYPVINKDVIYLSHRVQPVAAQPSNQTQLMQLRGGSSPARDTVEVLTFLRASSSVVVKVGSQTYTYTAPAGVSAKTYPLATGTVSAQITGGPSVTSPFAVTNTPSVQDLQYHFVSSAR